MTDDVDLSSLSWSISDDDTTKLRKSGVDVMRDYGPATLFSDEEKKDEVTWSDYGRGLASGALNVGSSLSAAAEYATRGNFGDFGRRYLDEAADDQLKQSSKAFQEAVSAAFIPSEGEKSVFDVGLTRVIVAKGVVAAPSLVASIIPAGVAVSAVRGATLATRIAVGSGVGKGAASVLNAGDVAGQIYKEVDKLSHDQLVAKSDVYRGYIDLGMTREAARAKFRQDVAGAAPIAAAAVTYATGGIEGQAGALLGGKAKEGLLRGAIKGFGAEAIQEALESGSGEALTQGQLKQFNLGEEDWRKVLNATVEGLVVGGFMGGFTGGVTNIGGRRRTSTGDETLDAALPKEPGTGLTPTDEERSIIKGMDERLGEERSIDPAQEAALRGYTDEDEREASGFWFNQETPNTEVRGRDTGLNTQEDPRDLDEQQWQLLRGERPAMLYPKGTPERPVPPGMRFVETDAGVVHFNPDLIDKQTVEYLSAQGRENEFLGLGPFNKEDVLKRSAKTGEPLVAVTETTPTGATTRAAVGTTGTAPVQQAELQKVATPGNTVQTEPLQAPLERRMTGEPAPAAATIPVPPKAAKVKAVAKAKAAPKVDVQTSPDLLSVEQKKLDGVPEGMEELAAQYMRAGNQGETLKAESAIRQALPLDEAKSLIATLKAQKSEVAPKRKDPAIAAQAVQDAKDAMARGDEEAAAEARRRISANLPMKEAKAIIDGLLNPKKETVEKPKASLEDTVRQLGDEYMAAMANGNLDAAVDIQDQLYNALEGTGLYDDVMDRLQAERAKPVKSTPAQAARSRAAQKATAEIEGPKKELTEAERKAEIDAQKKEQAADRKRGYNTSSKAVSLSDANAEEILAARTEVKLGDATSAAQLDQQEAAPGRSVEATPEEKAKLVSKQREDAAKARAQQATKPKRTADERSETERARADKQANREAKSAETRLANEIERITQEVKAKGASIGKAVIERMAKENIARRARKEAAKTSSAQLDIAATLKNTKPGQMNPVVSTFLQEQAQLDGTVVEETNEDPNTPQMQQIEAKPSADVGRLAKLLGPKLYGEPKNLGTVTVKEIVQNSFDAIKARLRRGDLVEGNIDIEVSPKSRTISVRDNGAGMSPETLAGPFLTIAGTKKETQDASGGLGIAKMLFLFGNNEIEVITARDGKVSILKTSGPELFSAMQGEIPSPQIEVMTFQEALDRRLVDEWTFYGESGTQIVVKIPESYKDSSTGEEKAIDFPTWISDHPVLSFSPLFDNINVSFNGTPVPIGSNFPASDFTQFANVKFDWGTARVYISKEEEKIYGYGDTKYNLNVLSNGLWQFGTMLKEGPDFSAKRIQRKIFVDVRPTVRPEDAGYPFDLNRQRFSPTAEKAFGQIFNYITAVYKQADLAKQASSFGKIQYFEASPLGGLYKLSPFEELKPERPQQTALTLINAGDQITVEDGKLIVNGREIPELTEQDLKSFSIDTSALKVDPSLIRTDRVMIHDNVQATGKGNGVLGLGETGTITELGRARFGNRFDQYLLNVGSTFKSLRDMVVDVMGPDYFDMLNEAVGVSFDKDYYGVSIRIPFSGSFINPAITKNAEPEIAGYDMVTTMIHELAHHKVRSHNWEFPQEMQKIYARLKGMRGTEYDRLEGGFADYIQANADILAFLRGVFQNEDLQSVGNQFQDGSFQSIKNAGDDPNLAGIGPSAERRSRVPQKDGASAEAGRSRAQSGRVSGNGEGRGPIAPENVTLRVSENIQSSVSEAAMSAVQQASNFGDKARKFITRFVMSNDQLRQAAERIGPEFGDAFFKVTDALERMGKKGREYMQRGHAIAEQLYKLRNANPKLFKQFAELANDATVNDIHPDHAINDPIHKYMFKSDGSIRRAYVQAEARHAELRKKYLELVSADPRFEDAYKEAKAYFVEMQEAVTRANIDGVLAAAGDTVKLPEGKTLRDLSNWLFDGGLDIPVQGEAAAALDPAQLTQAQMYREALGEKLTKHMAGIASMKKLKGAYFPLMRRGDYVIQGYEKFDTMGGRYNRDEGTVYFDNLKDAKSFARKTDIKVLDIEEVAVGPGDKRTYIDEDGKTKRYNLADIEAEPVFAVKVQNKYVEFFETAAEAQAAHAKAVASGDFDELSGVQNRRDQNVDLSLQDRQVQILINSIQQRKGLDDAQKKVLVDSVIQSAITLMPGSRVQHRRKPRRYVAGASDDLVQNTLDYSTSVGNYRAKQELGVEISDGMKEVRAIHDKLKYAADDRTLARDDLVSELESRITTNAVMKDDGVMSKAVRVLLSLSFLDKLASPAYSLINSMQPWMVTQPILAAKYGWGQASSALMQAYADIGGISTVRAGLEDTVRMWKVDKGTDFLTSYKDRLRERYPGSKGKELVELLDYLAERGAIDPEAGLEIARLNATTNVLGRGLNRAELIARALPTAIEAMNRATTALAEYNLSRSKNLSHEAAMKAALTQVNNTQGNYSATNAAPIFNHPLARISLQFKKYGQMMYHLIGQNVYHAFKGATPAERAQARKALLNIAIVHTAMAGALGLPTEPIKLLLLPIGLLGGPDYDDLEDELRQAVAKYLGNKTSEVFAKGLPRLVGFDLSSRVGLDSLLTFGGPRDNNEQGVKTWLFDTMAGAPVGLISDWAKVPGHFFNGDINKGLEKLVPLKVVADSLKAYREGTEGKVSKAGRQTMPPTNAAEMALRSFGLTPQSVALKNERDRVFYRTQKQGATERQEMMGSWLNASKAERGRKWDEIRKWNGSKSEAQRITLDDLKKADKRRESEKANGTIKDGYRVNKRDEDAYQRSSIYR